MRGYPFLSVYIPVCESTVLPRGAVCSHSYRPSLFLDKTKNDIQTETHHRGYKGCMIVTGSRVQNKDKKNARPTGRSLHIHWSKRRNRFNHIIDQKIRWRKPEERKAVAVRTAAFLSDRLIFRPKSIITR